MQMDADHLELWIRNLFVVAWLLFRAARAAWLAHGERKSSFGLATFGGSQPDSTPKPEPMSKVQNDGCGLSRV